MRLIYVTEKEAESSDFSVFAFKEQEIKVLKDWDNSNKRGSFSIMMGFISNNFICLNIFFFFRYDSRDDYESLSGVGSKLKYLNILVVYEKK